MEIFNADILHMNNLRKKISQITVHLEFQKNDSECFGRTPTAGEVAVTCYIQDGVDQHSFADTFPFTPIILEDTYTHTATSIPENMFCSYTVSLSSTENYKTVSQSVMFSKSSLVVVIINLRQ